jgi:hypothetical protein
MTYKQHRSNLSALCLQLQTTDNLFTVKEIERANLLLEIYYYNNKFSSKDIRTIEQWNALGYIVNAGEKAKLFWGEPILQEVRHPKKPERIVKVQDFFPVVFKFNISQVTKIQNK